MAIWHRFRAAASLTCRQGKAPAWGPVEGCSAITITVINPHGICDHLLTVRLDALAPWNAQVKDRTRLRYCGNSCL
jgi:hypothetical protein